MKLIMEKSTFDFNLVIYLFFRLALRNTELLKNYISCNDVINDVVFTLRHWAKLNDLIGRNNGQVTSYAFTLMIIHFLQQSEPCYLHCLQTCHGNGKMVEINGWNCWFCEDHSSMMEKPHDLRKFFFFP